MTWFAEFQWHRISFSIHVTYVVSGMFMVFLARIRDMLKLLRWCLLHTTDTGNLPSKKFICERTFNSQTFLNSNIFHVFFLNNLFCSQSLHLFCWIFCIILLLLLLLLKTAKKNLFKFLWWTESSKEQHLSESKIFCNIKNVFITFMASLLNYEWRDLKYMFIILFFSLNAI